MKIIEIKNYLLNRILYSDMESGIIIEADDNYLLNGNIPICESILRNWGFNTRFIGSGFTEAISVRIPSSFSRTRSALDITL